MRGGAGLAAALSPRSNEQPQLCYHSTLIMAVSPGAAAFGLSCHTKTICTFALMVLRML